MAGIADWDELRFVKRAAEHGSFTAAASSLGVNAATVLRRINALEERLGSRLFYRSRAGLDLTQAGQRVLTAADAIFREIQDMEFAVVGCDVQLEGNISFSTTDDLALAFAEPALHAFVRQYPSVTVELRLDNKIVNLNEREADIVLRCTKAPPALLVGRMLGDLELGVYVAKSVADRHEPNDLPWIIWGNAEAPPQVAEFEAVHLRGASACLRINSFLTAQRACSAGLGLAVLPSFMARKDKTLHRVTSKPAPNSSSLWLLTHERLRRLPRIRAFMDMVGRAIATQRAVLDQSGNA